MSLLVILIISTKRNLNLYVSTEYKPYKFSGTPSTPCATAHLGAKCLAIPFVL